MTQRAIRPIENLDARRRSVVRHPIQIASDFAHEAMTRDIKPS
jgi:hypothetical protein